MACEHKWDRARICSRCGYILKAWVLDDGMIYIDHAISRYLTPGEARDLARDLLLVAEGKTR